MTITSKDIAIYQAQDNTDNDSGGGTRTNVEIIDGEVNNLFPDISRVDSAKGDVALRKIHPTVTTENNDVYYGAHLMLRETPKDPKVSSLIFHTDDPHDTRKDAQDRIESYITASYKELFYLFSTHPIGSKTAVFLSTVETPLPEIGNVYLFSEGLKEQYVRISDIAAVNEITFNYNGSSYTRKRITCELEYALEYAFTGSEFHPAGQQANTCTTYSTQISDASRFYGTKFLAVDALAGDETIKLESIFEQLVPASKKNSPLLNQQALSQGQLLVPTGEIRNASLTVNLNSGDTISLPDAVAPGTITTFSSSNNTDDGLGNIRDSAGTIVATIDYKSGIATWLNGSISGGFTVVYEMANLVDSKIQYTASIYVDQPTQSLVYVKNMSPAPSAGDLYIDYRTQGKWYRIASNPDGSLGTDAAIGTGLITNNQNGTASVSVTLGALPDLDSTVIFSWGSAEQLSARQGAIDSNSQLFMEADLGQKNIDPLSFQMQMYMPKYGAVRNITADTKGNLVEPDNNIKGYIDTVEGKLIVTDSESSVFNLPSYSGSDGDIIINFDYAVVAEGDVGEIKSVIASRTPEGQQIPFVTEDRDNGILDISLGESVDTNSVRLELELQIPYSPSTQSKVLVASNGVLYSVGDIGGQSWGNVLADGTIQIRFNTYRSRTVTGGFIGGFGNSPTYGNSNVHYALKATDSNDADNIIITYKTGSPNAYGSSHNITGRLEELFKYVIQSYPNVVGEVAFNALSESTSRIVNFFSKDGVVYNDTIVDGVGTNRGVIDYVQGRIELSYFTEPDTWFLKFTKYFTDEIGTNLELDQVTFRTAATKLSTGQFQLTYETIDSQSQAASDSDGVLWDISDVGGTPPPDIDQALSYVDPVTGMAKIVFTKPALPDSLIYDAVAEVNLPLDAEQLGLNPVRLPSDGRVPIFKAADLMIITNEVETPVGTPTANQVVNLGRTGQSYVEVIDVDGKRLDTDLYVADRSAGTLTFIDGLGSLVDRYGETLTAPFSVIDRVEDMLVVTDVQINGLVSLSAPLNHDYPKETSRVASSLVFGDTGARVYNIFSQTTWSTNSPVWADQVIGGTPSAKYNDVAHPIQITNYSSLSGRWAIYFRSSTTVDVIEENLGVVQESVSITSGNIEPLNPATGQPYWSMPVAGLGGGWSPGNALRFNTDSGDNNAWLIRTTQSGALSEEIGSIAIEYRGDAN